MPLISIIVPIYRVEEYLDRCVQSILAQTYKDIEIILVDDGSPDRCPQMCDEYALKDARIKVIHKQNGGLSSARNAGMERMSGEYFMFVDSDDRITPETTEILYKYLLETKADISMCEIVQNARDNVHGANVICGNSIYKGFLKLDVSCSAWAKLYKTQLSGLWRFKEGVLYEDMEFMSRYLPYVNKIADTGYQGYLYTMRNSSILHTKFQEKNAEDYIQMVQGIKNITAEMDIDAKKELEVLITAGFLLVLKQAIISNAYRRYSDVCKPMTDWLKQNLWSLLRNKYVRRNDKIGALLFVADNDYLLNLLANYLIRKRDCI